MDCTGQYKLGERKRISCSINLPCSLINLHANITWFPATSVFLKEQTKFKPPQGAISALLITKACFQLSDSERDTARQTLFNSNRNIQILMY